MNLKSYMKASGVRETMRGGQHLIYAEIVASLAGCGSVWLPWKVSDDLRLPLDQASHTVYRSWVVGDPAAETEAVYFGTPTVVDGAALFPEQGQWDAALDREWVSQLAKIFGGRIVCGLGSGDVSVGERCEDMGGRIVCYKNFEDFEDWVIVRD